MAAVWLVWLRFIALVRRKGFSVACRRNGSGATLTCCVSGRSKPQLLWGRSSPRGFQCERLRVDTSSSGTFRRSVLKFPVIRRRRVASTNAIHLRWIRSALLLIMWTSSTALHSEPGQATQTLTFQQGWNLVTFKVLPTIRTPEAVLGSIVSTDGTNTPLYGSEGQHPLLSIYHIRKAPTGPAFENFPISSNVPPPLPSSVPTIDSSNVQGLTRIEYGEAYFIRVQNISADAEFSIVGFPPPSSWRLSVEVGFSVLGIPGVFPLSDITTGSSGIQPLNILSLFRPSDLQNIVYIARWDAKNQVYQYYDPQEPERAGFQVLDTGLAHWFNVKQPLSLVPDMVVQAQGDQDNAPFASPSVSVGQLWQPGAQDISINIPGRRPFFTAKPHRRRSISQDRRLPCYSRCTIAEADLALSWKASLLPFTDPPPSGAYALKDGDSLRSSLALGRRIPVRRRVS